MTNEEVVLSARQVSKKFAKTLRHNMVFGLRDLAKSAFGFRADYGELRSGEFWAVEDLNLELRRGQVLGLAGLNGSGKTTLIQLLGGIIPPNRGEIRCKGKISTIVSLGAGFNPLLTGRENIRVKAAMQGMSREEIDDKMEQIVAFADLREFIDSPFTFYSSGMRVRLGFAVASSCDPDILLLDEIFAVGDRTFRHKCLRRMEELKQRAGIIITAHEVKKIARICNSMIVLERGKKAFETDNIAKGIEYYNERYETNDAVTDGPSHGDSIEVKVLKPEGILNVSNVSIPFRSGLEFSAMLSLDASVRKAYCVVGIMDQDANLVSHSSSEEQGVVLENRGTPLRVRVSLPNMSLMPGRYRVSIGLENSETSERVLMKQNAIILRITGEARSPAAVSLETKWMID